MAATATMSEADPRYPGWRVAGAAALGIFCWAIPPYSFAVFLRPLTEEFGWSRQSVSAVFGIAAMTAAVCSIAAGVLIDRVGPRRVVVPCLLVGALAFLGRAFIEPPFWHVVVLFALSGVAGSGASPLGYLRMVSGWFDRRRGQALGIAIAGSALGSMMHPPVAQALIDLAGWRRAHLLLGAFMLFVGVPVVAAFARPRAMPGVTAPVAPVAGATVTEGLGSRLFWVLAAVLLVDSLANSSVTIHLPAMLGDRGLASAQGALALSAMGAAAVAGRLVTGWAIDRIFAPYISVALLVASALGLYVLTTADTLALGVSGAVLVGFGMGGEGDITPYLLSRYFGLRSFSTLYGAMFAVNAVAWAIGPTLMGRTHDATGSYVSQLVVLMAGLAIGVVLMLTLPRYAPATASAPAPAGA